MRGGGPKGSAAWWRWRAFSGRATRFLVVIPRHAGRTRLKVDLFPEANDELALVVGIAMVGHVQALLERLLAKAAVYFGNAISTHHHISS